VGFLWSVKGGMIYMCSTALYQ